MKSGFVTIVGKPNVGKSTLINSIVGQKISISSPKPQTTRNKITGIYNDKDSQIVFVDTPGFLNPKSKLDEYMKKSIDSATLGIDALIILLDGTRITDKDFELVEHYSNIKVPIFVVINKKDIATYEKVYPKLARFSEMKFIDSFFSVSARTGENVTNLIDAIKAKLSEGIVYYDTDMVTDKSERFLVSEIIREKALLLLQDEIPHGIAVDIVKFEELKKIINIDSEIIVSKENHKQIVIGKGGSMLKEIGSRARVDIENMLQKKVNLQIFVKVREKWQDNATSLREFGYDKKDI